MLQKRGPMVPKGTPRAPVSPFQTTVWHSGNSVHITRRLQGRGTQNTRGGQTKKRGRWKKRKGGEQTDDHKCPQATFT